MVNFIQKDSYCFDDLLEIMDILRGDGGCPWDIEQTHESIRRNFIEEVYEACEAIDEKNSALLCEELGDVLLQVVFHTHIAKAEGEFELSNVTDGICKKLILRHPHIFGNTKVSGSAEVLKNWDDIKRVEKNQTTVTDSMEHVAKSLPALIYSEKVQAKARKAGFDWKDVTGALLKVREETDELEQAIAENQGIDEELGDLLFAVVNVSRFVKQDPEQSLINATTKFMKRFANVERMAEGKISEKSFEELDELWNAAKKM